MWERSLIYLKICYSSFSSLMSSFDIILIATIMPIYLCLAKNTEEVFPFPNYLIIRKSFKPTFRPTYNSFYFKDLGDPPFSLKDMLLSKEMKLLFALEYDLWSPDLLKKLFDFRIGSADIVWCLLPMMVLMLIWKGDPSVLPYVPASEFCLYS